MTDPVRVHTQAGIERPCPRCDAEPGAMCHDPHTGRTRATTHRDRKPKAEDD